MARLILTQPPVLSLSMSMLIEAPRKCLIICNRTLCWFAPISSWQVVDDSVQKQTELIFD